VSRLAIAAAVLAVAAMVTGGAVLLAGGQDGRGAQGRAGSLIWAQGPRVVTPPTLPTDRVMWGQVRNDGLRDLKLTVDQLRVVDSSGRALKSNGRFLQAFVHGLYGASGDPTDIGDYERRRLGQVLTLKPGRTAPLTVSWRGPGARRVTIGEIVLPIPR
jgi:hypothetical protein